MLNLEWFLERVDSSAGQKVLYKMDSKARRDFQYALEQWNRRRDDGYLEQAMDLWEEYDDDIPSRYRLGSKRR